MSLFLLDDRPLFPCIKLTSSGLRNVFVIWDPRQEILESLNEILMSIGENNLQGHQSLLHMLTSYATKIDFALSDTPEYYRSQVHQWVDLKDELCISYGMLLIVSDT